MEGENLRKFCESNIEDKACAHPGIGYGASGTVVEDETVPDIYFNMLSGLLNEYGVFIKNTGVGPGEHVLISPGADVDAASG